jgi:hypothetical protein
MGKVKNIIPVKLFTAITFRDEMEIERLIREEISTIFGPSDCNSDIFNFSIYTDYYQDEMGNHLNKVFTGFQNLIEPERLPKIKIKTNNIESRFTAENKRTVNIDPGYITLAKVVLATTKDYSHRIYLSDGIYGDVHLIYTNRKYMFQPWTYPDYQQNTTISFFTHLRSIYASQLSGVRIEKNNL